MYLKKTTKKKTRENKLWFHCKSGQSYKNSKRNQRRNNKFLQDPCEKVWKGFSISSAPRLLTFSFLSCRSITDQPSRAAGKGCDASWNPSSLPFAILRLCRFKNFMFVPMWTRGLPVCAQAGSRSPQWPPCTTSPPEWRTVWISFGPFPAKQAQHNTGKLGNDRLQLHLKCPFREVKIHQSHERYIWCMCQNFQLSSRDIKPPFDLSLDQSFNTVCFMPGVKSCLWLLGWSEGRWIRLQCCRDGGSHEGAVMRKPQQH